MKNKSARWRQFSDGRPRPEAADIRAARKRPFNRSKRQTKPRHGRDSLLLRRRNRRSRQGWGPAHDLAVPELDRV